MSKSTCQWFHFWHMQRFNLLQCNFTRDKSPITPRDRATWVDAVVLLGILSEDLGFSRPANVEVKRWLKAISSTDVIDVVKTFKDVDALLLRFWEEDTITYDSFKHCLPENGKALLRPIWPSLVRFFKYESTVAEFRKLHQWLAFLSRVNFLDFEDKELLEEYVAIDNELDKAETRFCREMNEVLRSWLNGFSVTGKPRHGNGAVAEKISMLEKSLARKYKYLGSDHILDRVSAHSGLVPDHYMPFGDRYLIPYGDVVVRTARVQLVPKTALKRRTICMEPAALQYWQHMVSFDLMDWFKTHPTLSRHIKLEDSTFNRDAARDASFLGVDSTVDLSAASDRISWRVVCRCFKGTTLLPWLVATRSHRAELPDGRVLQFKKFAPMGSALCFPVETLIFAAACVVASKRHERGLHSKWKVYGDDIVIETELIPFLYEILTSLGFVVNKDKSFTRQGPLVFRESCGGEYLGGVDVTPVRISRRFRGGSLLTKEGDVNPRSATMYAADIELANAFYDAGLAGCRRWILQRVLSLPKAFQPVFGPNPGQLHSDGSCDNFGRKTRFLVADGLKNPGQNCYQQLEIRAGTVIKEKVSPPSGHPYFEEVRYLEWWLAALRNPDPYDRYGVCVREPTHVGLRQDLRLVSRWVPVDGPSEVVEPTTRNR